MKKNHVLTYLAAFLVIILLNFLLPRLLPGDTFMAIYGQEAVLNISEAEKQELIAEMSLDKPLFVQFGVYVSSLLLGNLGFSYSLNAPVWKVIAGALPWTALLVGSALVISTALGIVLGVESGWRKGSRLDRFILLSVIGMSGLPNYVLGVILLLIFSVQLNWLPLGGALIPYSSFTGLRLLADVLWHMILPVTALTLAHLSETFLLTRSAMLGNISSPYILTAKAKGLKAMRIRYSHAGRNSLLPVSARLGVSVGRALAGALFVEIVFTYPGLGTLTHHALNSRDYPLLQGIFLVMGITIIAANIIADRLAAKIDPRMQED